MSGLPSGLTIQALIDNPPCSFFIVSKIKRGRKVVYACRFCHHVGRDQVCPTHKTVSA